MAQLLCIRNNTHQHDLPDATSEKRDRISRRGDVVSVFDDGVFVGTKIVGEGNAWDSPPIESCNFVIIDVPGAASLYQRLCNPATRTYEDPKSPGDAAHKDKVARRARYLRFSELPTPKRIQLNTTYRVPLNRAQLRAIITVRPMHRPDYDTLVDVSDI